MKKAICILLVVFTFFEVFSFSSALADVKRNGIKYKTLNYNYVMRYPMSNWGVKYVIKGKVLQIFRAENKLGPSDTYLCFRIATKGDYDNVVVCRIDNSFFNALALSKIIEGDKVTVYCSCDGRTNFKTILGRTVSLPIFKISDPDDIKITNPKKTKTKDKKTKTKTKTKTKKTKTKTKKTKTKTKKN